MNAELAMFTHVGGGAVEATIARDLARKAAIVAPLVVIIAFVVTGSGGAFGAAIALAVVALNFVLAAALMTWGAKVSAGALMGASLGGFIVRLAIITIAAIGIRAVDAIHFPTFLIVLVVAHLGLLAWELRSVSLTLAYPGLKPKKERA